MLWTTAFFCSVLHVAFYRGIEECPTSISHSSEAPFFCLRVVAADVNRLSVEPPDCQLQRRRGPDWQDMWSNKIQNPPNNVGETCFGKIHART